VLDEHSAELAKSRAAQGDVVTRLWKLDAEAKRDKMRRLEEALREEEKVGAGAMSSKNAAGASPVATDHVINRLAQADVEARRENLQRIAAQLREQEQAPPPEPAQVRKSKQVSAELAAKRAAQGDVVTRLSQVDVDRKNEALQVLPQSRAARRYPQTRPARKSSAGSKRPYKEHKSL